MRLLDHGRSQLERLRLNQFPILESGSHKLTLAPGIYISPFVRIRENYDFYTAYTDESFELIEGSSLDGKTSSSSLLTVVLVLIFGGSSHSTLFM